MKWDKAGSIVLEKLIAEGYEAYIAGGAVRDSLLNRPVNDVDVVTDAPVEHITALFPRTIRVGVKHGTVIVPVQGLPVEVSTFKGATLAEDLAKRDFTINAMARSVDGILTDPFNGSEDLKNGVIRTINSSSQPFEDDPLRLLRALRFAHQFSFRISRTTSGHLAALAPLIAMPAVERIAQESEKMSLTPFYSKDWKWLLLHPVVRELPYFFRHEQLCAALTSMKEPFIFETPAEWWSTVLFSQNAEAVKESLSFFKRSNELKKDVTVIHDNVRAYLETGWEAGHIYKLGRQRLSAALKLLDLLSEKPVDRAGWFNAYDNLPLKSKKELAINGKDLMAVWPSLSGWRIGELLKQAESAVVTGRVDNDKETLVSWIKEEAGS